MAQINLGGQMVEVSDDYNDLSEAQQKKFRRRLSRRMGIDLTPKPKEKESTGVDDILRFGVGQGLALGFGDEIEAGARSLFEDRSYSDIRDDIRKDMDSYREDNPGKALAMELGGGLLTGGAGLARAGVGAGVRGAIKQAAKVGAATGGVAGFGTGEGSATDQALSTVTGAGLGAGLGAALPAAGTAGKKFFVDPIMRSTGLMSKKATDKAADMKILQALEEEGATPASVQQQLDNSVDGTMLADVTGEAGRGTARGATVASGKARTIAEDALDTRQADAGFAMADDLAASVGANKNATEALDEVLERQTREASTDFDKAFFTRSADGETSVPNYMNISDLNEIVDTDAFKLAYNKARRIASNSGSTLPPLKSLQTTAKRSPKKIMEEFDQYTRNSNVFLEGQQGYIQKALREPEYRKMLEKSNPAYKPAIDLMEEYESAIGQGRIELTQQQGHFIKMGMDAAIDSGKRSGSLSNVEQGQTKQIRTKLKDILNQSEDYANATKKFAGDAAIRDAIDAGSTIFKGRPEQIKKAVSEMSESEKEAFRIGVAQAVRDRVSDQRTLGNSAQDLFKNQTYKDILREAFPDQQTFDAFSDRMNQRINQEVTRTRVKPSSGSKTAFAEADGREFKENADILANLLSGRPVAAAGQALGRVTQQQSGGMGQRIARDMFSTDRGVQRAVLDRLAQVQRAEQERLGRSGLLGTRVGGSVGAASGLLSGGK